MRKSPAAASSSLPADAHSGCSATRSSSSKRRWRIQDSQGRNLALFSGEKNKNLDGVPYSLESVPAAASSSLPADAHSGCSATRSPTWTRFADFRSPTFQTKRGEFASTRREMAPIPGQDLTHLRRPAPPSRRTPRAGAPRRAPPAPVPEFNTQGPLSDIHSRLQAFFLTNLKHLRPSI